MTCTELVDFLAAWLDGTLPVGTRMRCAAHLAACPQGTAYVQAHRETVRLGRGALRADDAPVPDDVPEELVRAILDARPRR